MLHNFATPLTLNDQSIILLLLLYNNNISPSIHLEIMDATNIVHGQRLQSMADYIERHAPAATRAPGVGNPNDNMDLLAFFTSRFFLFTFVMPIVVLVIFGRFFKTNDADAKKPERHDTLVPADKLGKKRDEDLPQPSEIVSLRIYPIKSCRGIIVNDAKLLRSGLELDRNWYARNALIKHDTYNLTLHQGCSSTLRPTNFKQSAKTPP